MIRIEDLSGIPETKRKQAIECLDDLLTFKDNQGILAPVISGYNWYVSIPSSRSVVLLSNIHETEAYKHDMLRDLEQLGYAEIQDSIRQKAGAFIWDPQYRTHTDNGELLSGLRVKDARSGLYIVLSNFQKPLTEYPEYRHAKGHLIAEDQGWELDIPFRGTYELQNLVGLFLKKASEFVYDNEGDRLPETEEERVIRAPWADAYRVPVVIIGEDAVRWRALFPQFDQATRICLIENGNEISFIVHKNLEILRGMDHYEELVQLGFKEESCLANKPFLKSIDLA